MYRYITKAKVRPYRMRCAALLIPLRKRIAAQYGPCTITLIGSGVAHLVTKNGNDPFDLDYNLILSGDKNMFPDPQKLKDFVRLTLDRLCPSDFKSGQDSTSTLTYQILNSNGTGVAFSFDLSILVKTPSGYYRLIFDKSHFQYIWNKQRNTEDLENHVLWIHKYRHWNELRELYLQKKNENLKAGKSLSSFAIYIESVNEIYQKFVNKGE